MKKTKEGKKAISLIVLVITVIIMTILAGAIILTLNNSGIIEKATDAVEQTNLATVKELTQMAWAEAYARGERTEEGLKEAVDKALEDNKVDTTKYKIEVTTSGVIVELKSELKAWRQEGLTVTNGSVTLELGDIVNYTATGTSYNGGWQVLGASDKGELLILSSESVDEYEAGNTLSKYDGYIGYMEAFNLWWQAPAYLDDLCELYGNGKGATGARSINIEDVNKVTGYNPEVAKYGEGTISEYGNELTYSYNGFEYDEDEAFDVLRYSATSTNGSSKNFDIFWTDGNWHFCWYDGEKVIYQSTVPEGNFATVKNTFYEYNALSMPNVQANSKVYNLLFNGESGEENFDCWLASTSINAGAYGLFGIKGDEITSMSWWNYNAGYEGDFATGGVRAIVSLGANVQLTGSSETGWSY